MPAQHTTWTRKGQSLAGHWYCQTPLQATDDTDSTDEKRRRLNPRNGLCLNALHDRAFDRHLMWIEDGYVIRFSRQLHAAADANNETIRWLKGFDGARLLLPKQFAPDTEFLKRHAEKCSRQQCILN